MGKITIMVKAVARYVPDSTSIAMDLKALILHAVAHEIIRQRCRDLTLSGIAPADWHRLARYSAKDSLMEPA